MDFSPNSRQAAILPGRFTTTRISSFSREWWSLRWLTGSLTTGAASSISTQARATTTSGSILARTLTMPAFKMWAIHWQGTSLREFSNALALSSAKIPLSSKAISKIKSPRESPPGSWRTGRTRRTASPISSATRSFRTSSERVDSQFRDFAAAVAAADIAAAKNQLTANIQNRVADAQKKLAKGSRETNRTSPPDIAIR